MNETKQQAHLLELARVSDSFPIDNNDLLRLRYTSLNTGGNIILTARIITENGVLQTLATVAALSASTSEQTLALRLTNGRLVTATARITDSSIPINSVFGTLEILWGSNISTAPIITLVAGYITYTVPLSFPAQPSRFPTSPGGLRKEDVKSGGTTATWNVPANETWQPISLYVEFSASAVAANRSAELTIFTAGAGIASLEDPTPMTANNSYTLSFVNVATPFVGFSALKHVISLPEGIILPPNSLFELGINNPQAGDTIDTADFTYDLLPT